MDIVLNIHDRYLLTPYIYPEQGWPEDNLLRQIISLTVLVNIHAVILYFSLAGFSYLFLYDKRQMNHTLFLKVTDIDKFEKYNK
jgi:lathosterol oxidase